MITVQETRDIAACRALRRSVFIEEQGVPEADELDDQDGAALHFLAVEAGENLGSARMLLLGDMVKIGRVCVLQTARGRGIGAALIRAAVDRARAIPGAQTAKLGAQIHALAFYESLGFQPYGPEYLDAGIWHRDMKLALS